MPNEFDITDADGLTLYGAVQDASGNWWNGTAFELYNGAHWSLYAIPLAKTVLSPAVSAEYTANFPATIPQSLTPYSLNVYIQLGGSPATTDGAFTWQAELIWDGPAASPPTSPCYFATIGAADALAATIPPAMIPSYLAANSAARLLAVQIGTADIDTAMRYQGRKFDPAQLTEFPRIAYETAIRVRPQGIVNFVLPPAPSDTVWDWDATNQVAITPRNVLSACIYQADFVIGDPANARLFDIHSGISNQQNSGVQETYDGEAPGVETGLSRRAYALLKNYRLVSGRLT